MTMNRITDESLNQLIGIESLASGNAGDDKRQVDRIYHSNIVSALEELRGYRASAIPVELTDPLNDSELTRLIWGLKAEGFHQRLLTGLVELQQRRNADRQPVPEVMICDMCGHDAWLQEHGTYECDEGHLFEVRRTPISKGGAA